MQIYRQHFQVYFEHRVNTNCYSCYSCLDLLSPEGEVYRHFTEKIRFSMYSNLQSYSYKSIPQTYIFKFTNVQHINKSISSISAKIYKPYIRIKRTQLKTIGIKTQWKA